MPAENPVRLALNYVESCKPGLRIMHQDQVLAHRRSVL